MEHRNNNDDVKNVVVSEWEPESEPERQRDDFLARLVETIQETIRQEERERERREKEREEERKKRITTDEGSHPQQEERPRPRFNLD